MGVELGVWSIQDGLRKLTFEEMESEGQLEDLLEGHLDEVVPGHMVIGRQVQTSHGKVLDLLAVDIEGNLTAVELKRGRTPRDIVAQLLDYGWWVRDLEAEDVARIFTNYLRRFHPDREEESINDAFERHFGATRMPEELNGSHQLWIVASELDGQTERIIEYLAEEYGVEINGAFFRFFRDGDREYLCHAWLRSTTDELDEPRASGPRPEWNGEFYVNFGAGGIRDWEDARRYGFVMAGGGRRYSAALSHLEEGSRIWVNVPGQGYVGVGRVTSPVVPVEEFTVEQNGKQKRVIDISSNLEEAIKACDDPENAEYVVGVDWIKTVPLEKAVKETGFFGNQHVVARPRDAKWDHTLDRLRTRFKVDS